MGARERNRRLVPRRGPSFSSIARLMLIPVVGLLLVILWSFIATHLPPGAAKPEAPRKTAKKAVEASAVSKAPQLPPHRGDVVLILDDVGFDRQPLAEAMEIDPNLNFAVLPNARNAVLFANTLNDRGFEVLCHLPMEPEGFPKVSPGANAVLTTMTEGQIAEILRADLASVPHARGVNNHMGSRATADRRVMTTVMASLPKGMYFIDSRTTADSVAAATARSMNVKTASRSVFLDDVAQDAAIRAQLQTLLTDAEEKGVAVGIGHMYPSTIRVLTAEAPLLRERGFRFVRASAVVR